MQHPFSPPTVNPNAPCASPFPVGFYEQVGRGGRASRRGAAPCKKPAVHCMFASCPCGTHAEGGESERGECDVRVRSSTLVDDSPLSSICLASVPPPPCLPARLPGLPADGGLTLLCTRSATSSNFGSAIGEEEGGKYLKGALRSSILLQGSSAARFSSARLPPIPRPPRICMTDVLDG